MPEDQKITVVSSTGISSASNLAGNDDLADRVHDAMQNAVRQCLDEGIIDPTQQRERMMAAREAVLAE
jgi:hypothetical protein